MWTPAIIADFDGSKGKSVLHYAVSEGCPQRFLWVGVGERDKIDMSVIRTAASTVWCDLLARINYFRPMTE